MREHYAEILTITMRPNKQKFVTSDAENTNVI